MPEGGIHPIAHSPLVKTALFASAILISGRLLAAIGYAGIEALDINRLQLYLDDVLVAENGEPSLMWRRRDSG